MSEEIKLPPFKAHFTGRPILTIDGDKATLKIIVDELLPNPTIACFEFSLNAFGGEEKFRAWLGDINQLLRVSLGDALLMESAFYLRDLLYLKMNEDGIEDSDPNAVIKEHAESTGRRLKGLHQRFFPLPGRGQPSQWNKTELAFAVAKAFHSLSESQRTYNKVADVLKKTHPEKAPASGGSLRQMIRHFGLNWKSMKACGKDKKMITVSI
jgi:hypothetical protein